MLLACVKSHLWLMPITAFCVLDAFDKYHAEANPVVMPGT